MLQSSIKLPENFLINLLLSLYGLPRDLREKEGERRGGRNTVVSCFLLWLISVCACMNVLCSFPAGASHVQLGQSLDIVRLTGGAAAAAAAATAARHQQHEHHISRRTSTHRGGSSRMPRYLTADLPADVPGPTHAVPTSCARV